MRPFLVSPRALELYVAGDGQRFTTLIREWANVYLRRCGATNFSINGVSWRPDGGVDGLINDAGLNDPLGWFDDKTAMQFKAGTTSNSNARIELLSEAPVGEVRIRDKIAEGCRVVWFIGRTLPDLKVQAFEDVLKTAVKEVNASAPDPLVIDLSRLADLISCTPAVAMQVASNPGLFNTSDAALKATPHSQLPTFVPGSHYDQLRDDVIGFFLGADSDQIKYIAGEPGIGKSRSILEAVESSEELKGTICYFVDPSRVAEFFTLARQENWRGCVIIDEFIGESATTTRIDSSSVPNGIKVLLIGHSYATNRLSRRVTNQLEPLTEDEVKAALAATYTDLQEFRIREAVQMSKDNIRLARLVCHFYRQNPTSQGLDATSLGRIVSEELDRMTSGQDVLKRLSLLPNLLGDETAEFCDLVEIDKGIFKATCRETSASSALIQFNDHVAYIGSPAVAQLALMRFWNEDQDLVKRILANPGQFSERMLVAINKLPACSEKEAMLAFFTLPTANLKLTDLMDQAIGSRFLNLVTGDPETYLPVLHRIVMDARGHLGEFPYEGSAIGRRDIIWRVRDLAQFAEYFEKAEEIVYAFVREEALSAYANTASTYWVSWFHSYFDHTTYPYDKRLDLLEARARNGDDFDQTQVIRAISDPFPHSGMNVPSSRVGGRVAPPELNFIHHSQMAQAAERIPKLIGILLESDSPEVRQRATDVVLGSRFSWLEHGAFDQFVKMICNLTLPADAKKRLVADTRNYIDLGTDRDDEPSAHVKWMRDQHVRLLTLIDDPDPLVTVLEVAERGMWRGEEPGSAAYEKLTGLKQQCLADTELFAKTLEILGDPTKHGGGTFGRLLGVDLSNDQFSAILDNVRRAGFSQFTYSALSTAATGSHEREEALRKFASELEVERPRVSLSIYQFFGDDDYFREAGRLLSTTSAPAGLFTGFFLRSSENINESIWGFVDAIAKRYHGGDQEAGEVLVTIAGEFARNKVRDERAYMIGLPALERTASDHHRNALADWSEIAVWMYERSPNEVIQLAASREQSEFSEATKVLAEIAKLEPEAVLRSLIPKLRKPYEPPFLLNGGLACVIENIPTEIFERWVRGQEPSVLATLAGHLPKPALADGNAIVPEITRKFWEICTADLGEAYTRAQGNFGAHTFGTGVYWGHGVDLFADRVELGRKLVSDPDPAIRAWAENFVQQSERMLDNALRSKRLDEARRATSD